MINSTDLKTVHSVVSSKALGNFLKDRYGKPVSFCQLRIRGVNDTYDVVLGGLRCAVRVFHSGWRKLEDAQYEVELLDYLAQELRKTGEVQVPTPIADAELNWIQQIGAPEGQRVLFAMSWCDGMDHRSHCTRSLVAESAELLAKIHTVSTDFPGGRRRPLGLLTELDQWKGELMDVFARHPEDRSYVAALVDRTRVELDRFDIDSLPQGVCHGDVHAGNFLQGTRTHLIDFDVCGWGPLVFDVASYLWSVELFQWEEETAAHFLSSYQRERPLSERELAAIPLFKLARDLWHLATWAHNVEALGTPWFADHLLDQRLQLLRTLATRANIGKTP